MRQFIKCKSRATAWKRAPWAAHITKAEGGLIAFKSADDWHTWRNQK